MDGKKLVAALLLGAAFGAGVPGAGVAEERPGVVDLNSATLDQLVALPGVGEKTAQAILDARKERGGFESVEELLDVRGIGAANLEKLRPHLRLGGQGGAAR
ncbi:MAG: helix-hairpin-helix domain-containing protein [Deltaproteobacteria bacterium]|nr:helix-hairpin-helix domain-containing protein [Deltaproteobacteria bacterium]